MILSRTPKPSWWMRGGKSLLLAMIVINARGASLTVQTNVLGPTPDILGYNSAHFYPGSNTKEWWRYSGVSGARIFIGVSDIEPSDDIAGRGDGVTNQATFLSRRTALRASPLNTNYINWPAFTNNYQNADLGSGGGANHIKLNFALTSLRELNVEILAQITASESALVITNDADWAGKWELWQHYYAQAFYLGRYFEVQRYQMFNEPDIGTITTTNWLMRLRLVSDAVQSALADVNSLYGKSLTPFILAPVTAGNTGAYTGWGDLAVSNRHVNFLGATDTNFLALHRYDYHQYNTNGANYGSTLTNFASLLTNDMAPEPRFPLTISEFNTHTGANFDALTNASLDSPDEYSNLGAIAVNLLGHNASEAYCFKFGQTLRSGGIAPVAKNATHYIDNTNAPYHTGGITKAGEVWRLVNKAFAPGRSQMNFTSSGLSALDQRVSYDPVARRYYIFSANTSGGSVTYTVNLGAWNLPVGNKVLIEEVSENRHGGGRTWGSVSVTNTVFDGTDSSLAQPANTVWLFTLPAPAEQPEQILTATEDAHVQDSTNNSVNYGSAARLAVRNDPTNRANREVTFIKFRLPPMYLPDTQLAVLSLRASTTFTNTPVQAHVYGLDNNAWSEATLCWTNAPNLKDAIGSPPKISNNWVEGLGTNVHLLGQLVVSSTNKSERLIDVTDFLRGKTNYDVTFMISQDPRWDTAIPALTPYDAQPDGLEIVSTEGGTTNTPGPQLKFVRLKDTDADGLSDEAEVNLFGTNPNKADTDGDGVNDGLEVLVAGTNPNDANSFLKVTAVARLGGGFRVDWPSATGKTYRLFRATNLGTPDWQPILTTTGTGALMTYTDPLTDAQVLGAPRVFYRLQAE